MNAAKGFRSAAPVLLLLVGAGVGCSLMLDTEYDKYGPLKGAGGTAGATGGTGGTSTEGGTPDVNPGGAGGVGGVGGQGGEAGDSGPPDADAQVTPPHDPPPPGEVCPFWSPPSCADGLICAGTDCCESRSVPGGSFPMGENDAFNGKEHEAVVSPRCVDTFEVTVGRFRKFVESYTLPESGAGAHPNVPTSGWNPIWNPLVPQDEAQIRASLNCGKTWQTWTDSPEGAEDMPINCVSWYNAFAFCVWDGARLLSEAEWEHASAAGAENRLYPWGFTTPDDTLATYCHSTSGLTCTDSTVRPRAVGSTPLGASLWGQQDIAGNVWEWNLDWYSQDFYNNFCSDCVNVIEPGDSCFFAMWKNARTARGGSFNYGTNELRAFARGCNIPSYRDSDVGFRCVRDL